VHTTNNSRKPGLVTLLGMATAPRYTPGGLQTTINARSDDRGDKSTGDRSNEQPGQKITVENANEYLHWLLKHRVIICNVHQYTIRNVAKLATDDQPGRSACGETASVPLALGSTSTPNSLETTPVTFGQSSVVPGLEDTESAVKNATQWDRRDLHAVLRALRFCKRSIGFLSSGD